MTMSQIQKYCEMYKRILCEYGYHLSRCPTGEENRCSFDVIRWDGKSILHDADFESVVNLTNSKIYGKRIEA